MPDGGSGANWNSPPSRVATLYTGAPFKRAQQTATSEIQACGLPLSSCYLPCYFWPAAGASRLTGIRSVSLFEVPGQSWALPPPSALSVLESSEVGKQVFGVRGIVQRTWVLRWIETRSTEEPLWSDWRERHPEISRDDTVADLADAQRQLASIELQRALLGGLSPHELQRVFNLPVEQLCAQIGAAADLAMSEPPDHAELLLALTGPAWLKEIDSLAPPNRVVNGRIFRRRSEDNTAYALVAQAARSGVDMMQISLGQRWQRGVRLAAIYVSGLLGVTAAVLVHGSVLAQVLLGAAALVLGGFFSWLTRDLVAIVERVRR